MRTRLRRLVVVVLASLALTGREAAATPAFEPSLGLAVDGAYDSNVFNGRGPDFVTRITPRFNLRLHDPRYTADVGYGVGVWIYGRGKAENSANQQGVVAVEGELTRRLRFRVGDEIIYAHDPGFLSRAGVVAPQTSIFDNTLDARLAYRFARRIDGELDYSFRHTGFGTPPPGSDPLFDGDEHDGIAAIAWRFDRRNELRLADRVSYYTAAGFGLAVAHTPTLAWHHQLLPALEWRVEGGPIFYDVLDAGRRVGNAAAQVDSGTTFRASALVRLANRNWRATLAFTRDLVGGTGAASVLWVDYVAGQIGYRVHRAIDLNLGVGYFANGYAPDRPRLYDGFTVDAVADFVVVDGLHVGAYYAFRLQNAPNHDPLAAFPPITRNIAGVRIAWAWGGGRHLPP